MSERRDPPTFRAFETQDDMIKRLRAESVLDKSVPLGFTQFMRPQLGITSQEHYSAKHERGEYGTYYPLHLTKW